MAQPRTPALPRGQLAALLIIVLANYLAQVPYALDLYGTHVSGRGLILLALTLAWFLTGVVLNQKGRQAGHWLLFSFLVTEFAFYFHGQILGIANGYGLVYLLVHAHDTIVRWVFVVGDINFAAAGYFALYLLRRRKLSAEEVTRRAD
ncbi:MAG TPA: hypothetical protein VF834_08625, partial [Streptosporangiaceae bacterium]